MGTVAEQIEVWQWILVIGTSIILFFISPWAKTSDQFFKATKSGKAPNMLLLTGSLVISWVFAKSIANASDLGYTYGIVGGVAYATYYLSFIVGGYIIYRLRVKGNFESIHQFLQSKFGRGAIQVFSLVIAFRLFNEIWSNTMVIGSYFGDFGSSGYFVSIIVFTVLTLAYSLKGGLNSSIFSDAIQMALFSILLIVILSLLFNSADVSGKEVLSVGTFSTNHGVNLIFIAFLQSFSYPFHDPVMTDRGFISSPKKTLYSFILAGVIGFVCIFLFSLLGIFSQLKGVEGGTLIGLGSLFGPLMLLLINFIMIVSAASTLDSSFSSFSKLSVVDLKLGKGVRWGRITMIIVAVAGTIPIFFNPEILSATTISGTMVIGLTPVFLLWKWKAPKISYYLSIFAGVFIGIMLSTGFFPSQLIFTEGPYNELLWSNILGVILCFILYLLPMWYSKRQTQIYEV